MNNIRTFIDLVLEANTASEPGPQARAAIKALIGEAYINLDTIADPEQKKYYRTVHRSVFSLLKELDHTESVLFLWYFYKGYSVNAIANQLKGKFTADQVHEIVHRIYNHMLEDSKIKELIVKHMEQ
jgi:hypothetical protein